ncbi:MAG TPA: sulfate adenylyltransferase subunit CysD, partial [Lacunisphaera sp.]|nr:sulfate adenylyltransferase subunit CysD [Lacunisphaera sp.]
MSGYQLDHLAHLETEAIHLMRECAGEFERPALLFSGGKDSICLLRLAEKAFRPSELPLPLLNVDTGHHFPELNEFRDRRSAQLGARLIVRRVEDAIAQGLAVPAPGEISRNRLQIPTLLAAIEEFRFDCCIGGARRDEEKARAKERFFSFRDRFGQWDPKNQRPEIWNLYNGRLHPGENMRVFPLSNWTEMDIWEYIAREQLEVPSIYFSHRRACVRRSGQWLPVNELAPPKPSEEVRELLVRVRT